MNTLTIKRFNGDEIYNIKKALLKYFEENSRMYLKIHISTDFAMKTLDDSKKLKALPTAEIKIIVNGFDKELLNNATFCLKNSYDNSIKESLSTLYYVEHQELDNNEISIERDGDDLFRILWSASTTDVCFYDGSKPDNKIIIEAEARFIEK